MHTGLTGGVGQYADRSKTYCNHKVPSHLDVDKKRSLSILFSVTLKEISSTFHLSRVILIATLTNLSKLFIIEKAHS